ncbi:hypothetical protein DR64_805 [Paraburkholderia xenovorans LB400]|jgi:hypothetical protein|uniref:DUF1521 domain-containing protein n=1 Tax=Paraburkholderia xenovorans (strain LB400) TaxID=266265 RepID=Q141X6_PARXL|nr:DUF1521 domain-containing protein [Paraburkholderia xenovorans]ABE29863.1 hypothetical protein Bxe_A3116 [Paraburkholderia xenovorans LB400]AIP33334.1 hypothetical protein DR64_805 [Paraburkholderia xenovorans LB400]
MQAAMQTNQFFALQANTNVHSHGAMQSQPLRASAYGARGPSPQMSNMMGGFSKSSFAMSSHSSANGANTNIYSYGAMQSQSSRAGAYGARNPFAQTSNMGGGFSKSSFAMSSHSSANGSNSSFFAQATSVSRGRSASQPPGFRDRHNDSFGGCDNATGGSHVDNSSQVQATGFNGTKGKLETPLFNIDFNKSDSAITLTNKQTGATTTLRGDPHYNNQGTFTGALDFKIPGGHIVVDTKAAKNDPKVSYADKLTLTLGGKQWEAAHISQDDSAPLTLQKGNATVAPHGYELVLGQGGKFVDPKTGKEPTQKDFDRNKA